MIRSVRLSIAVPASSELVATALVGVEGLTRRVTEIMPEIIADRILRAYKATDRIVDVHCEVDALLYKSVPVDLVLGSGDEFKVGFLDESGSGSDQEVVVFYEET